MIKTYPFRLVRNGTSLLASKTVNESSMRPPCVFDHGAQRKADESVNLRLLCVMGACRKWPKADASQCSASVGAYVCYSPHTSEMKGCFNIGR